MHVHESRSWMKHIDFIVFDVICLVISFLVSYDIRNGFDSKLSKDYDLFLLILIIADMFLIFFFEQYKGVLRRGYYVEFISTLKQTLLLVGASTVFLFASKWGGSFSRIVVFTTFVFYFVASYVIRILWKKVAIKFVETDKKNRKIVVIAEEERVNQINYQDLIWDIEGKDNTELIVVDKDLKGRDIQGVKVVANSDDMMSYLVSGWVDEIFVDINPMSDRFGKLYEALSETGITVHVKVGSSEFGTSRVNVLEYFGKLNVLTTSVQVISPLQRFVKRTVDILGSIIGLVITAFIGLFIAPAIKMADPGPAFYVSERVGLNGKKFKFYKFRSMYQGSDLKKEELREQNTITNDMMFKLDNDPRVIKGIGEFIRKYSIDEFPQFLNVLKGDMSLVGTRPPTVDEWNRYKKHHRTRLCIKPGITGLWQVSGRSEITDFEEVVKLDNKYISEWNYGLDIKILLMTIWKVLKGEGAK